MNRQEGFSGGLLYTHLIFSFFLSLSSSRIYFVAAGTEPKLKLLAWSGIRHTVTIIPIQFCYCDIRLCCFTTTANVLDERMLFFPLFDGISRRSIAHLDIYKVEWVYKSTGHLYFIG
jgi:hypothetical protein